MIEDSGFFVGQVGALIRLDTEDSAALLAVATKKEIHYRRPESGTTGAWTASLDGTKLTYLTTLITDLPEAGDYLVQAYIEGPGWKVPGKITTLRVLDPVKPIV